MILARPAVALLVLASLVQAQDQPAPPQAPMAQFAAQHVTVLPAQLWRADTAGWSHSASWVSVRAELDSALTIALRDGGLAGRWSYAGDVVRAAKRNVLYAGDPTAIGVGRWRGGLPKSGDNLPQIVADNLRQLTALGDGRYALIPVELRGAGDAAVLRVVIADTRTRTVTWSADIPSDDGAGRLDSIAARIAALFIDP